MAIGIIAGSAIDMHLKLLHKYEDKGMWSLWYVIEALHKQKDVGLHHSMWVGLRPRTRLTASTWGTYPMVMQRNVWMSSSSLLLSLGCAQVTHSINPSLPTET